MHGEAANLIRYRGDLLPPPVDGFVANGAIRSSAPPQPDREIEQDEAYEPLAYMGREIARKLGSQAVLIAWHAESEAPVRLFYNGSMGADRRWLAIADASLSEGPSAELHWRPLDEAAREGLIASLPSKSGVVTITAIFDYPTLSSRERASSAMQRLIPLIKPFFRMWALHLKSKKDALSLAAAVDHSHIATVLVDTHGELQFVNEAAGNLIACGEGLRRTGKHLAGDRLSDTLRLQASIEHALSETCPGSTTPVVALTRRKKRALLAAVVAHRSEFLGASSSEAVIYIFDPEQDLREIAEPVCKHYGLSPVETKLACLLVEGASLSDAAQHMRVREQTARTYLKQLFSKTDTKRQAEFVLLMLKSSVRLLSRSGLNFV